MTRFDVGDLVKLKEGPIRYEDRVGVITDVTKKNGRTTYSVDFSPRRKTPFMTSARNLRLWE